MCERRQRTRQIVAGAAVIAGVGILIVGGLTGWRYLPGGWADVVGTYVGLFMTPFVLEATFLLLGLGLVVWLNRWHRRKAGDDFVYLEEGEDGIPDHAKWAVFPSRPVDGEIPSLREQAEGALAISDYESAAECFAAMTEEELRSPEVLGLRMDLARATGRTVLAAQLEAELSKATGSAAEPLNTTR